MTQHLNASIGGDRQLLERLPQWLQLGARVADGHAAVRADDD